MKKMLNEGNQIHNFMSSSGSPSQKVTVPVPQRWFTYSSKTGCGVIKGLSSVRGSYKRCSGSVQIKYGSGSFQQRE